MRAAICVIGVALLAAFLPHGVSAQTFRQETPSDYKNRAPHDWPRPRQDPLSGLVGRNNFVCQAPHNDRSFSWSMVMRDPQPGKGGWKDWEPPYYREWRRMDSHCH